MPRMTLAEYVAYEARAHCRTVSAPVAGVAVESDLHDEIYDECRRRGWIALHGRMDLRTGRTAGEPDFVILADGGRTLLVECKARSGKLSLAQAGLHAQARKLGHEVFVVRTLPEFLAIVTVSHASTP